MKLKVSFKGDLERTFDIFRAEILPVPPKGNGPSMLTFVKRGDDKYVLSVTPDIIPDFEFLEKIELLDE